MVQPFKGFGYAVMLSKTERSATDTLTFDPVGDSCYDR